MFYLLGLFLVLISWIGIAFILFKWRDKNLLTISRHAATNKQALSLFAAILIVCGILFYFWLIAWFVPHLHLNFAFTVILTVVTACQILTALIPDTEGWRRMGHRIFAYTMAVLYLPLGVLIIASPFLSSLARIISVIGVLYMFTTFLLIVVLKKLRKQYLIFQILYIMVFQFIILVAAYT